MKPLQTPRLTLRPFTPTDITPSCQNWASDPKISDYLAFFPHKTEEQTRKLIESYIHAYENPDTYIWAIEEKESHQVIGSVTVDAGYRELSIGEIGYLLGSRWWHHGYASEAVHKVLEYMLLEEKFYMIEAKYNIENTASGNLLKRLGMKQDGVLRGRRIDKYTGERKDLVICSMVQKEFS